MEITLIPLTRNNGLSGFSVVTNSEAPPQIAAATCSESMGAISWAPARRIALAITCADAPLRNGRAEKCLHEFNFIPPAVKDGFW